MDPGFADGSVIEDWFISDICQEIKDDGNPEANCCGECCYIGCGVFFIIKATLFDLQYFGYIKRYIQTYLSWNQVEIWLMMLTIIKFNVVLPDYYFKEINWFFWIFIINSFVTYWLSHVIHMRSVMMRQASRCAARSFVAVFAIKIITLICIILAGPIFDNLTRDDKFDTYSFKLTCSKNYPYPIRFLLVFFMDFFWATFDLFVWFCSPKTASSKARLKTMRIADIEKTCEDRRTEAVMKKRLVPQSER